MHWVERHRAVGDIFAEEIDDARIAGLLYEKAYLDKALVYAREAAAHARGEERMYAEGMLGRILRGLGREYPPVQAELAARLALYEGKREAAADWLRSRDIFLLRPAESLFSGLNDAYALLLLHQPERAVLVLKQLRAAISTDLDAAEADLLLGVAFFALKDRGISLRYLSRAVERAQEKGNAQIFVECAALCRLPLAELSFAIGQQGYASAIDAEFLRELNLRCGKGQRRGKNSLGLSKRQEEIARWLSRGYSYQEIAEETGLQFSTVKSYVQEIYNKLGVESLEEAMMKLEELTYA